MSLIKNTTVCNYLIHAPLKQGSFFVNCSTTDVDPEERDLETLFCFHGTVARNDGVADIGGGLSVMRTKDNTVIEFKNLNREEVTAIVEALTSLLQAGRS